MTKLKERPVPSSEAIVKPDFVTIRSWVASENKYNEFEVSYNQVLENLRGTKIGFLYKNICGPQIDEDDAEDDQSSEKEEEKKESPVADKNKQSGQEEPELKESATIQSEEEYHGPHRLGVKGPKKRLTQIPRHE